jgi:hypothetical protein
MPLTRLPITTVPSTHVPDAQSVLMQHVHPPRDLLQVLLVLRGGTGEAGLGMMMMMTMMVEVVTCFKDGNPNEI